MSLLLNLKSLLRLPDFGIYLIENVIPLSIGIHELCNIPLDKEEVMSYGVHQLIFIAKSTYNLFINKVSALNF